MNETQEGNYILFFCIDIFDSTGIKLIQGLDRYNQRIKTINDLIRKEDKEKLNSTYLWKFNGDEWIFIYLIDSTEKKEYIIYNFFKNLAFLLNLEDQINAIQEVKSKAFIVHDSELQEVASNIKTNKKKSTLKELLRQQYIFKDVMQITPNQSGYKNIDQKIVALTKEVYSTNEDLPLYEKDWIGAKLDIGFRLSSEKKTNFIQLSLELAYLLTYLNFLPSKYTIAHTSTNFLKFKGVPLSYPEIYLLKEKKEKQTDNLLVLFEKYMKNIYGDKNFRLYDNLVQKMNIFPARFDSKIYLMIYIMLEKWHYSEVGDTEYN